MLAKRITVGNGPARMKQCKNCGTDGSNSDCQEKSNFAMAAGDGGRRSHQILPPVGQEAERNE